MLNHPCFFILLCRPLSLLSARHTCQKISYKHRLGLTFDDDTIVVRFPDDGEGDDSVRNNAVGTLSIDHRCFQDSVQYCKWLVRTYVRITLHWDWLQYWIPRRVYFSWKKVTEWLSPKRNRSVPPTLDTSFSVGRWLLKKLRQMPIVLRQLTVRIRVNFQ